VTAHATTRHPSAKVGTAYHSGLPLISYYHRMNIQGWVELVKPNYKTKDRIHSEYSDLGVLGFVPQPNLAEKYKPEILRFAQNDKQNNP
jgi:hypothetical protein